MMHQSGLTQPTQQWPQSGYAVQQQSTGYGYTTPQVAASAGYQQAPNLQQQYYNSYPAQPPYPGTGQNPSQDVTPGYMSTQGYNNMAQDQQPNGASQAQPYQGYRVSYQGITQIPMQAPPSPFISAQAGVQANPAQQANDAGRDNRMGSLVFQLPASQFPESPPKMPLGQPASPFAQAQYMDQTGQGQVYGQQQPQQQQQQAAVWTEGGGGEPNPNELTLRPGFNNTSNRVRCVNGFGVMCLFMHVCGTMHVLYTNIASQR